jgi:uncharacterized protein YprB with RNaseH-like and TPR domain
MNLKDKLDRYAPLSNPPKADRKSRPAPPCPAECEHLTETYPPRRRHSGLYVDSLGGRFGDAAMALLSKPVGRSLDFGRIAFIDTETTGLSGGAGVCAFLIGIGYLTKDGFVVEQFMMSDFPAEPEMLRRVGESLEGFEAIAGYNSRAFDIPILDTRFVLNGVDGRPSDWPQLDLLHASRRIWKHRLESCGLQSLEANVLDFFRVDDIESWLIPQTYFEFLRTGDRELIEPILSHNRLDILSLAFVAQLILGALDSPRQAPLHYGEDWFGLGTLFEKHRRAEEAAYCFERAIEIGLPGETRARCTRLLSLAHKRKGDWDSAVRLWNEEAEEDSHTLFALEELAKFYEHRRRDLTGARETCRRALTMLEIRAATSGADFAGPIDRFEYRLQRIEKKIRRRIQDA